MAWSGSGVLVPDSAMVDVEDDSEDCDKGVRLRFAGQSIDKERRGGSKEGNVALWACGEDADRARERGGTQISTMTICVVEVVCAHLRHSCRMPHLLPEGRQPRHRAGSLCAPKIR